MAPRRPRSSSNVSASTIPRAPTSSPQLKKQFAASIDSIYHNNITVLQRRDPSILSIMDQFSHVCLYHYNGKKWEKQGFEGSMFLVEHQEYPPYGMYILNRMGTGDYERRLYPEDDMEVLGDYLMYRYYPDFTRKRLEMHLPYPLPPHFKPLFDQEFSRDNSAPDQTEDDPKREKKGNSVTLGLWMFPSDAREPLKDVMMRLHNYVKRGEPYPDQFRYGPGRPPPPNPHLSRANHPASQGQHVRNGSQSSHVGVAAPTMPSNAQSEVDRLFAKLQGQRVQTTPVPQVIPPSAPSPSVQSLFAALTGQSLPPQEQLTNGPLVPVPTQQTIPTLPPATSTRGLALLNTIFASVSQPADTKNGTSQMPQDLLASQPPPILPPQPEEIQIIRQALARRLLLLGSNGSRRSATNRYEGDNEMSESEEPHRRPAFPPSSTAPSVVHPHTDGGDGTPHASVQGDVTPRAARGTGAISPAPTTQPAGQPFLTATSAVTTTTTITTTTTNPAQQAEIASTMSNSATTVSTRPDASGRPTPRARALVPFSTDSELWPYPRAPLNDNEQPSDGDADVVELDFSDTRALSDPSIFKEKQAKQQGKGERRKKTRKERAAEREKEREAIENGWDDPTKGQVTIAGSTTTTNGHKAAPSLSSTVTNGDEKTVTNGITASPSPGSSHNGVNGAVNETADAARGALLTALATNSKAPSRDVTRKQFVQEVLSLIYSDSSFVDKLYQEYINSSS
ncbi:hypothetical protein NM688_g5422 [Phlebia brevispora]|uniref:Uncharacterized protein n=1 Tax=Phlebia brevispora TaxID=194682 RepID=A0ACC1SVR5_9APHY|nr:hypothetical protein NM688_g5422 [Phlebia brevispora]